MPTATQRMKWRKAANACIDSSSGKLKDPIVFLKPIPSQNPIENPIQNPPVQKPPP
jgi:hypothetical protein